LEGSLAASPQPAAAIATTAATVNHGTRRRDTTSALDVTGITDGTSNTLLLAHKR